MDIREQLKQSTARIRWNELKSDILRDVIVLVAADLNLLDVAEACALDNKPAFEKWLTEGRVIKTDSLQHEDWNTQNPHFDCCMVKPFIFIKEILLN